MAKRGRHVQGPRGEAFVKLIRGVPLDHILAVSIDVHKDYHLAGIHNGYGDIVVHSFRVDIFRSGFEKLCAAIDNATEMTEAEVVFIAMEPTGHYFENLARHLLKRYPLVRLVNSYSVKQNRNQKMLQYEKTDEIDRCAIGDLVLRNDCFPFRPLTDDHLCLQNWVRLHEAKVKARTALRNQVIGHLDRIFPGLVRPRGAKTAERPRLFSRFWDNEMAQSLIRLCPDPRRLAAMQPAELIDLFHAHHYRMGPVGAKRIIHFAHRVLLPDPQFIAARLPLLALDLELLDDLDRAIALVEEHIAHYLSRTKGQVLTHIKGIGTLRAASYVAGIGNPDHYENARQTFRRSGLVSGRNDSGTHQRGGEDRRVTKVGDTHLRRALVQIAHGLSQWQPYFDDYRASLEARGKHKGVAIVATARKINGVLFALMRDQTIFEPLDKRGRPVPPRHFFRGSKQKATTSIGSS